MLVTQRLQRGSISVVPCKYLPLKSKLSCTNFEESVLDEAPDLTPGDFVRSVKQLIDLLDQIASAPSAPSADLAATARAAIDALRRGVITYSAVTD